jgi:hypothetical protein
VRVQRYPSLANTVFAIHPKTDYGTELFRTTGVTNYERILQHRNTLLQLYNVPASGTNQVILLRFPNWMAAGAPDPNVYAINGTAETPKKWMLAFHYGRVMVCIRSSVDFTWSHFGSPAEARIGGATLPNGGKIAVVIETKEADSNTTNDGTELTAFRNAVLAQPLSVTVAGGIPTANYTTLDGTAMSMTFDQQHRINGVAVNYAKWPMMESPWNAQAVNRIAATGGGSTMDPAKGKWTLENPFGTAETMVYDFNTPSKVQTTAAYNWYEAEEAAGSSGFGSFRVKGDGNASQSRFIEVPNGAVAGAATALYPFTVPAGGAPVSIWLRTRADPLQGAANIGGNDSFTVDINGDGAAPLDFNGIAAGITWGWVRIYNAAPLNAGSYNLAVSRREDGTQLDRVLITTDTAYNPAADDARNTTP